jgi:hypothetical protein
VCLSSKKEKKKSWAVKAVGAALSLCILLNRIRLLPYLNWLQNLLVQVCDA